MRKTQSRTIPPAAFAIILIASLLLPACGRPKVEAPPSLIGGISTGSDRVIATVNGEQVKEKVFMEWYLPTISMSAGIDYRDNLSEETRGLIDMYKYTYLSGYNEQLVLLQDAKSKGISVDDAEVEEYRQSIMRMYGNSDEEKFSSSLAGWGFTKESFLKFLKDDMTVRLLYEHITDSITAPDQAPIDFYNENPDWFFQSETRLVRHILLDDLNMAMDTVMKLNGGGDFGELVKERSKDPSSAANGGVIGPFDANGSMSDGNGSLVEAFTQAAFALKNIGDITQAPVISEFGYHIIILDAIYPGSAVPFSEIEEDLTNELISMKKDEVFQEYVYKLTEAAVITTSYEPESK